MSEGTQGRLWESMNKSALSVMNYHYLNVFLTLGIHYD